MLHDKNLKATVASMKADAKAQFSKIIDIAEEGILAKRQSSC